MQFSFVAGEQHLVWNGNEANPGENAEILAGAKVYPSVRVKNTGGVGSDCRIRVDRIDTTPEENVFYAIEYIAKNGELNYQNAGYFVMPAHKISVIIRACHNNGEVDCIHDNTATFTLNVKTNGAPIGDMSKSDFIEKLQTRGEIDLSLFPHSIPPIRETWDYKSPIWLSYLTYGDTYDVNIDMTESNPPSPDSIIYFYNHITKEFVDELPADWLSARIEELYPKPEKEMQTFIVEDDEGIGVNSAYVKVTWYGGSSEGYTDGNGVVRLEVNSLFKLTAYASKTNYECYNTYCDRCVSNKCYRDDFTYLPTASMRLGLKKEGVAPPPGDAKAVIYSKSPTTDRNYVIGDTVDVELELINWGTGRGEIRGIVKKDGAIFTSCEGSVDVGDKISTNKTFVMSATTVALDFLTYHKYPAGWPEQYDEFESVLLTPVAKGVPKWGLVGDPVWEGDIVRIDLSMVNPRIGTHAGSNRYEYMGYLDLDGRPAIRSRNMEYGGDTTGVFLISKDKLDDLGYTATIKLREFDYKEDTKTWIDEVTKIIPPQPAAFNVKFAVDGDTVEVHPYILVTPGEANPVAARIENNGDTPVTVDIWERFGNIDIPPQKTPSIPPHSEIIFNYNFITPSVSPGSYPCTFYIGEHGGDTADEFTQPVIRVSDTIIDVSYDFFGVDPPPKKMVAGKTYQITLPITVNDILGAGNISADVWTVKDRAGLTSDIVDNKITIVDDRVFPLMESRRIGMSKTPLLTAGASHRIIHEFTVPTDLPLGPHTFATYFGEWNNYFLLNGIFSGYTFDAEIVTEVKPASFEVTVPVGVPPCTVSCNRVYKVPLLPLYITDPLWSPLSESCLSPPCSFGFTIDGKYIGDKFGIAALSAGASIFTFPEDEVYTLAAGATPVTVSALHAPLSTVDVLIPALGISVDSFVDALKLAFDFITETEWRELGRRIFNKSVEDFIMVAGTLWEWMPTKAMSDILILLVEGVGVYTVRDAVLDSFLHHSPIAFVAAATAVLVAIMAIIGSQIILCWLCEEILQGLGLAVWAAIDVGNWELALKANATFYKGILLYATLVIIATGATIVASYGTAVEAALPLGKILSVFVPGVIGTYFIVLAFTSKAQHDIYEMMIINHLPISHKPPMKGEITGAIKLTTEPAAASIYIKQEGVWQPTYMTTPQTLVLPVGTHEFRFYLLDWKNIEWEAEATFSLSKHTERKETIILKELGTGLPKEPTLITDAKVSKVVDGDTIYVTSPDIIYPLETPSYLEVRVLGMNTPDKKMLGTSILGYYARRIATVSGAEERWDIEKEVYTKSAEEAIDRLAGKTVTLRSDIDNQWGSHDRFLATVEVGGADYGAEMLSLGHAAVFFYSPNAIFDAAKRDEYIKAEKPAKDAEIGIWAPPPIVEPDTGKISCKSSPSTAEIWLDGKDTDYKTPKTLDKIAIGDHTVTFKAPLKCTKTLEQCRLLECSDTVTVEEGETKPADCNLCAIYEIHQPYYCKGRRCAEGIHKETFSPYIRIDGKEAKIRVGDHTIIKFGTDMNGNVYRFGTAWGGIECGFGEHTIELWLGGWKTMKATEKIDPGDYFEITPEIPEGKKEEEVKPTPTPVPGEEVPPVVEMTGTVEVKEAIDADTEEEVSQFGIKQFLDGCDCHRRPPDTYIVGPGKFCDEKKNCPFDLGSHTLEITKKDYAFVAVKVSTNGGAETKIAVEGGSYPFTIAASDTLVIIPMLKYEPDVSASSIIEESTIPGEIYLEREAIFVIKMLNTGSIPANFSTRITFEGTDTPNVFPFESEISDVIVPGEKRSLPVLVRLPERAIPLGMDESTYEISLVVVAYI